MNRNIHCGFTQKKKMGHSRGDALNTPPVEHVALLKDGVHVGDSVAGQRVLGAADKGQELAPHRSRLGVGKISAGYARAHMTNRKTKTRAKDQGENTHQHDRKNPRRK